MKQQRWEESEKIHEHQLFWCSLSSRGRAARLGEYERTDTHRAPTGPGRVGRLWCLVLGVRSYFQTFAWKKCVSALLCTWGLSYDHIFHAVYFLHVFGIGSLDFSTMTQWLKWKFGSRRKRMDAPWRRFWRGCWFLCWVSKPGRRIQWKLEGPRWVIFLGQLENWNDLKWFEMYWICWIFHFCGVTGGDPNFKTNSWGTRTQTIHASVLNQHFFLGAQSSPMLRIRQDFHGRHTFSSWDLYDFVRYCK